MMASNLANVVLRLAYDVLHACRLVRQPIYSQTHTHVPPALVFHQGIKSGARGFPLLTVVSFGWARLRTREKSEKFTRSFLRRTPEYISPSTRAREIGR